MAASKTRARATTSKRTTQLDEDDPTLLKRIRESINSGLVVLDADGRVVSFNKAAEEITGVAREEVRGRPLVDALGETNREILEAEIEQLTSRLENREIAIQNRAGEQVTIGFTVSPLTDETSSRVGTIFIFKDLTEIVSLREQMRQKAHFATVGEMTASIAHEIRNPLAAMHTAAETLKEELGYDEDKEEYVDLILREVKRVNALVSDFFAFIRPMTLALEPCDIHELLDVLIFIEGAKMKKSGVTLACNFAEAKPMVMADRNLLQQALLNILLNAYQATSASGEIQIETEVTTEEDGRPVLRVAFVDQGAGIAEENLAKIFQPFFSTKTKGIGLGLPITERIVDAMRGRIELTSELGHGSTFAIFMPLAGA